MAPFVSHDSDRAHAATRGTARRRRLRDALRELPYLVWLWPALLTLALTLYRMADPLLWWDELTTWEVATRSTGRLGRVLENVDAVHGTYYLFMHGWIGVFGDAVRVMRLPSALAMAGTAVCVACVGRRLFDARAGLAAGLVFALLPAVSRYGQEARAYALVTLAVALATWVLLRALDTPRRRPWWCGYALCVGAIGLLHLVALTVLAGHAVAVLLRARSGGRAGSGFELRAGGRPLRPPGRGPAVRPVAGFGLAAVAGLVCAGPVLVLGQRQAHRQISFLPTPGVGELLSVWETVFKSALVPGALVVLGLLAVRVWPDRRDALLLCAAMTVLPLLLVWTVSQGGISYFDPRYFVFTLPAWALPAGAGIARVSERARAGAVLPLALVALAGLSVPDQCAVRDTFAHHWVAYPADDDGPRMDYRGAADVIRDGYRGGDAVAYDRSGCHYTICDVGVRYYLPRRLGTMRDVFLGESAVDRNDLTATDCAAPERCLGTAPRIWLVAARNPSDPLQWLPDDERDALRGHYRVAATSRLTGLTVALLKRVPRVGKPA
ncbi:glycosyltransferase family 39 protein [Streptomyces sp. NPDC002004]